MAEPAAQPATPGPGAPPAAAADHDASRRAFFRELGRQAVTTVGQVAGMADMVGRAPTLAAANLLGLGLGSGPTATRRPGAPALALPRPAVVSPGASAVPSAASAYVEATYRSPYRRDGEFLRIVDQRALPGRIEELTCRRASDVVFYLRVGAARGGPLMAQLAAYALAMSADQSRDRAAAVRESESRRIRRSLLLARPSSRLLAWVTQRMERVESGLPGDDAGPAVAEALRAEADAIAGRMQLDQAAIARHLVELLPAPEGRPLSVLVHGSPGALAGGLVGTGLAALERLAGEGREMTVRVTETRPFLDGARLTSWELRQAGISHQVLPDAAVAWLLASEPVDAILVGAEWIAANGDAAAVVGSRAVALAAAAGGLDDASRPVPLIVTALSATIDPAIPDGAAIPTEMRPGRELAAFQSGFAADRLNALNPATDVIPAGLIGALVTEQGVLSPVTPEGLARLSDVVPADTPAS